MGWSTTRRGSSIPPARRWRGAACRSRCATTHASASSSSTARRSTEGRSSPTAFFEAATSPQVETSLPGRGYGYQWWTRDEESDRSRGGRGAAGVHRRRPGGGRRRAVRRRRRVSLWRGMRRRWADGTTHLEWKGVDFLGRLAVLVPQPRINLLLYCIWTRPQVSVGRHEDWTSRLQPRAGGAMMCHRQPWQNRSSVCRI